MANSTFRYQIGWAALSRKIQAWPLSHINCGSGPFHSPVCNSLSTRPDPLNLLLCEPYVTQLQCDPQHRSSKNLVQIEHDLNNFVGFYFPLFVFVIVTLEINELTQQWPGLEDYKEYQFSVQHSIAPVLLGIIRESYWGSQWAKSFMSPGNIVLNIEHQAVKMG